MFFPSIKNSTSAILNAPNIAYAESLDIFAAQNKVVQQFS